MISQTNRDIPAFAWIEQQILVHAAENKMLKPAVKYIEKKYGVDDDTFGIGIFRQTRLLSLLYLLLVFPKELRDRNGFSGITEEELGWSVKGIHNNFNLGRTSDTVEFMRRIRNAVSHSRVEITNNNIEFTDGPPGKEPNFQVTMTIEEVQQFLNAVGIFFGNNRAMSGSKKVRNGEAS